MEQLQSHIWLRASSCMVKYLRISSYSRKPFLTYDFATAPLWVSLNIWGKWLAGREWPYRCDFVFLLYDMLPSGPKKTGSLTESIWKHISLYRINLSPDLLRNPMQNTEFQKNTYWKTLITVRKAHSPRTVKKPFCFSFPSENYITKDWQSRCWYQDIFPATHRSFLHFPMPENSSGPWKETFCIPKCRKILPVPGMRHFTFLHAIVVWPLEGDLAWL